MGIEKIGAAAGVLASKATKGFGLGQTTFVAAMLTAAAGIVSLEWAGAGMVTTILGTIGAFAAGAVIGDYLVKPVPPGREGSESPPGVKDRSFSASPAVQPAAPVVAAFPAGAPIPKPVQKTNARS